MTYLLGCKLFVPHLSPRVALAAVKVSLTDFPLIHPVSTPSCIYELWKLREATGKLRGSYAGYTTGLVFTAMRLDSPPCG